MVAQAIGLQFPLQFLVSVLALAPLGVLVVHRCWQDFPARSVRDHCPSIGPLGVGFNLDHDRLVAAGQVPA